LGDKVNLALIGAGFWGKNLARVFHQLSTLKVICDSSEDILSTKVAEYPDAQTIISFSEVFSSQEINAVAIATPAETHFSMVKNSLLPRTYAY